MAVCPFCLTDVSDGDVCPACGGLVGRAGGDEGPLGGEAFLEDRTGAFYVTEDQGERLVVWWSWYPTDEEPSGSDGAQSSDSGSDVPPVREGVYLGRRYLAWPLPKRTLASSGAALPIERLLDFLSGLSGTCELYPFEIIIDSDGNPGFMSGRTQSVPARVPGNLFAAPERQIGYESDSLTRDYARSALLYCALAGRYPTGVFPPPNPVASSLTDPDLALFGALRSERSARIPFDEVKRAYTPPSPLRRTLSVVWALAGSAALMGFGAALVYAAWAYLH